VKAVLAKKTVEKKTVEKKIVGLHMEKVRRKLLSSTLCSCCVVGRGGENTCCFKNVRSPYEASANDLIVEISQFKKYSCCGCFETRKRLLNRTPGTGGFTWLSVSSKAGAYIIRIRISFIGQVSLHKQGI